MKIRGTDFVMFHVSDLAGAARFYREVLGLPQQTYNEEWQWAEFDCGDITLSLHGGAKKPDLKGEGRIALAVEDIQAAYNELREKGVAVASGPTDYKVCWAMEVHDPDGNTVILHRRADGSYGKTAAPEEQDAATIIALERAALERWAKGDPSGFLEISGQDVVYFDPMIQKRLDGLQALTRLYETIRGKIHLDRFEILNPNVQRCGDAAVLTYNFVGVSGNTTNRWNCTEVYFRTAGGWRIVQTHWSFTQPS